LSDGTEKDKYGHSALPNHGRAFVCCFISFFVLTVASVLSRNFRRIVLLSVLCGVLIGLSGITASYFIKLPSGSSIILIGGILLGLGRRDEASLLPQGRR
jgi:flagellar biosynthesis protein FliR